MKQLLPEEPPPGMRAGAVRAGRGAEIVAAGIAMQDLLRMVRVDIADAGALDLDGGVAAAGLFSEDDAQFARCFLDPSTYEVWVEPMDAGARARWHIEIFPEAKCAEGLIGGGGGEWEIDGETFDILRGYQFE